MNSFNVYGKTEQKVGGNTPVWLGTVKPMPRGAIVQIEEGAIANAGFPGIYEYSSGIFTLAKSPTMLNQANGYLYNDVRRDNETKLGAVEDSNVATCAVVMHHPEGLLIERVYPGITEEQIATLQENIPGVLLVRESNQATEE